jgi:hypothetical protein
MAGGRLALTAVLALGCTPGGVGEAEVDVPGGARYMAREAELRRP